MNIDLEKKIIKAKRSKLNGKLIEPDWFTKYGRYLKEYDWNNIIVYRPYKVKVTEWNAERLFRRLIKNNKLGLDYLWYALEKDRDTNWTHAHLLTNGVYDLNKKDIASTLRRSISEIKYLSKPDDKDAVSHYFSKYIGIGKVTGHGFIHKN